MIRRPFVVRGRRPWSSSVVHNFKDLLLRLADQVEILCGASLGSGIEILFAIFWSHVQDGRHAHIWYQRTIGPENAHLKPDLGVLIKSSLHDLDLEYSHTFIDLISCLHLQSFRSQAAIVSKPSDF